MGGLTLQPEQNGAVLSGEPVFFDFPPTLRQLLMASKRQRDLMYTHLPVDRLTFCLCS